jgi:pyruvate/2-oxoglutarate dehydrogenase complex dihydrolipoamide acyltransferase (E2) component
VTVLVACALMALPGCAGGDAGAATSSTPKNAAAPAVPTPPPATETPKSTLAGLIVVPNGYGPDHREVSGAFSLQSFLDTISGIPAEDRALLLNADFTEGYQAARISPDRKKQYTVRLFRTGSKRKAQDLRAGFWRQETFTGDYAVPAVPGVLTGRRVAPTGQPDESEAVAQASFVAGTMLAQITVRQTGPIGSTLRPDTKLATMLAQQQYKRLTAKAG